MTIKTLYDELEDDWDDDDDEWYYSAEYEIMNTCGYQYKDGKYCGERTVGDHCDQCGTPLCMMHAETGAMFCNKCPTKDYRPDNWRRLR